MNCPSQQTWKCTSPFFPAREHPLLPVSRNPSPSRPKKKRREQKTNHPSNPRSNPRPGARTSAATPACRGSGSPGTPEPPEAVGFGGFPLCFFPLCDPMALLWKHNSMGFPLCSYNSSMFSCGSACLPMQLCVSAPSGSLSFVAKRTAEHTALGWRPFTERIDHPCPSQTLASYPAFSSHGVHLDFLASLLQVRIASLQYSTLGLTGFPRHILRIVPLACVCFFKQSMRTSSANSDLVGSMWRGYVHSRIRLLASC